MSEHPYSQLSPDCVIDAVESSGLVSDLRVFPLNSYENRVYQVGIEDREPVIAKFYRPERWSDEQILEEHRFAQQLHDADIPVIPPWQDAEGRTLFEHAGFRFTLFKRRGGHAPALDDMDSLYQLGQWFGRIHAIGAIQPFEYRPTLDVQSFGTNSVDFLLEHFIPDSLRVPYETLCRDLLEQIRQRFDEVGPAYIRVHGDCHVGNILWRDNAPHFVDLDDSRMAPAIQDLWMFLSGERDAQCRQMSELVEGYNEFHDFDTSQLPLIEPLRTLRLMHYSAWLGRRWHDPAFPHNFPWFNTERFWSQHILELREQLSLMREPPLRLY